MRKELLSSLLTFLLHASRIGGTGARKVTKEKGSTNTAPLRAACRFATARSPSGPRYSCTSTLDNSQLKQSYR